MALLPALGCGERPEAALPRDAVAVVADFVDEPGVASTADQWRFDGGVLVDAVRIAPLPLRPGDAVKVRAHVAGIRGDVAAMISVAPPRPASRQVALGGVDAPPPTLPPDPRAAQASSALPEGETVLELTLPLAQPWHPQHAVVTMALFSGGQRIAASQGPRTDAGVAILGLVAVASQPTTLVARRTRTAPTIDGHLDDPAWAGPASPLVESLDGEPWDGGEPGTVALAWDESFLYAAGDFPDPDVWATYTEQDEPLWKEEVFELFMFGSGAGEAKAQRYLELQVSPRGVTFDAKFATYRKGDVDWDSTWVTAVDLRGSLDDRSDRDHGWSVEVAVPWSEICAHTSVACPPEPGTLLRLNAFRFERPEGKSAVGLSLSPTRVPDFHAAGNAAIVELGP